MVPRPPWAAEAPSDATARLGIDSRSRNGDPLIGAILTAVHLLLALLLIGLVLLHRGQGGGISDMFGGGIGGAVQGSALAERNLTRMTAAAVLLFVVTSVSLLVVG